MKSKKIFFKLSIIITMTIMCIAVIQFHIAMRSSADIIKNYKNTVTNVKPINPIIYNGEELYVANATFYDYYSDTQVTSSSTPGKITDALDNSKNTFSKFNTKIMELLHYNNSSLCPAKYPLYQGRPGMKSDMSHICSSSNEQININSNYWYGAQGGQNSVSATQGLIDLKLAYDSYGNSCVTQSNPANGKSAILPFFDKKLLTTNTFDNSNLPLGKVIENVSFPFRRVKKNDIIYYEFYSGIDTVRLNTNNQLDYLGMNNKNEQVLDAEGNPGFFPYNTKSESTSPSLNFGHGVKIEIPFNMTKDGKLNNSDIIFEFSGDDDVWVFIDDELVLDIGGNHGEVSGNINFAKGTSTVSMVKNNDIAFSSRTLGRVDNITNGLIKNKTSQFTQTLLTQLKNTSKVHTLTMFYMERGLNVANMKLRFNLPEPTKFTVTNTLDTSNVGETFKTETLKIANKDEFLYDIVDNTLQKPYEFSLLTNENILFIEEFNKKDSLTLQEKGLKKSTRKLTTLYSTNWLLKDTTSEIKKNSGLIVTDDRTSNNSSLLFANKNNNETPILTAAFTNSPKTGNFTISCEVTDEYKKNNASYANKEFKYYITYANVFGGNSSSIPYKGKYIVCTTDNKQIEKTTTDGYILLKPFEKAIIQKIPVLTQLKVVVSLDESEILSNINTSSNFKMDSKTLSAIGNIKSNDNIVQYKITIATKQPTTPKNETIPTNNNSNNEQLVNIDINKNALDASPKTSDAKYIPLWISIIFISAIINIFSFIVLIKNKEHE